MEKYVCTGENTKVSKGRVESHILRLWIIKIRFSNEQVVLFMEKKEGKKKIKMEIEPYKLECSTLKDGHINREWSLLFCYTSKIPF